MPEVDQRIVAWIKNKNYELPIHLVFDGSGISHAIKYDGDLYLVTHWVPVPDPPQEET